MSIWTNANNSEHPKFVERLDTTVSLMEGVMFEEVQRWKGESYRFEIDSSPEVYKIYGKIYSDEVKKKYQIDKPVFFRYNSGLYIDAPDVALINRLFSLSCNDIE